MNDWGGTRISFLKKQASSKLFVLKKRNVEDKEKIMDRSNANDMSNVQMKKIHVQ